MCLQSSPDALFGFYERSANDEPTTGMGIVGGARRCCRSPIYCLMGDGEKHMTLAWYDPTNHHVSTDKHDPLFTPLGQLWPLDVEREWVGLTDEEIKDIVGRNDPGGIGRYTRDLFKKIEDKLRGKNGG